MKAVQKVSSSVCLMFVGFVSALAMPGESPALNPGGRTVILLDLYHHLPPTNKDHRGSYESRLGRYTWFDRLHSDGFSSLRIELMRNGFEVRSTTTKIQPETLRGVDILLIVHPDSKTYLAMPNVITPEDVATIVDFVKKGGGLIVMTNSYGVPDRPQGDFDLEHTNLLARPFGIQLHGDYTGFPSVTVPANNKSLKAGWMLQYDNGCTMEILPHTEAKAESVLDHKGKPIVIFSRLGKGKAVFIGDSGSWGNGDMYRPGANHREIAIRLFKAVAREKRTATGAAGEPIKLGNDFEGQGKYQLAVRENVNAPGAFDLLNKLNLGWKHQILHDYLDENFLLNIMVSPAQDGAETGTGKRSESRIAPGLTRLLSSLRTSVPHTLTPGAEWTGEIPLKILPLDSMKNPEQRRVRGAFRCLGPEEVDNAKCVKIYASAYFDLEGLEMTDFISPGEIGRLKVKDITVAGGRENCEVTYYARLRDGVLVRGEVNTNATLWLRSEQPLSQLRMELGDLIPVFISEQANFRLLP